jgi:hypothetical protein
VQETDAKDIDWNSEEGKQATERLNSFLRHIDRTAARDGHVRKVVPIGTDDDGQELKIITWGKP